jgi:hypothetical protein
MFLNLAQSLRSLTASPFATALDQTHRQAQRYRGLGGAVGARKPAENQSKSADFMVPADIDAGLLSNAIDSKLRVLTGPSSARALEYRNHWYER